MDDHTSQAEKVAIVEEITRAFNGVSREDSVTLHQAEAIDSYDTPEEQLAARQLDTESRWQDVPVADVDEYWDIFPFLDAKGFRYYLPAYMIRALTGNTQGSTNITEFLVYALMPNSWMPQRMYAVNDDKQVVEFRLMTGEQSHAVYRFLRFLADHKQNQDAQKALDGYWNRFANIGE